MSLIKQLEKNLEPIAMQHLPEGSTVQALADQWIYSYAYNGSMKAEEMFAGSDDLARDVQGIMEGFLSDNELTLKQLRKMLSDASHLPPSFAGKFSFIDLFAGIGGMRLGFQNAGGVCVFSSEFEPNAQHTYKSNHGEYPFGDITKIDPAAVPDHDVLIGGFPCQPFSHAGLKLGIEDTRGTLFYNIAAIIQTKRPKFALLENVKGLISNNKGETLKTILETLTSIGYSCNIDAETIRNGTARDIQKQAKNMVLKSVDFGVPQNRQRIYIVLWRNDLDLEKFDYPQPTGQQTKVGDILEDKVDDKFTISDRLWEGHQNRKIRNKQNGKGFGFGIVSAESAYTNTISARYYKDGSEVLIEQEGRNPRKLTPREAARLQGFPDDFAPSQSNVNAYKQFGNSVSVPVIQALANKIKDRLNDSH